MAMEMTKCCPAKEGKQVSQVYSRVQSTILCVEYACIEETSFLTDSDKTSSRTYIFFFVGAGDNCLDCTPDELAALVREIRDSSGLVSTHTYHLVSYKNTIVGRELVDWLIKAKGYKSEPILICDVDVAEYGKQNNPTIFQNLVCVCVCGEI